MRLAVEAASTPTQAMKLALETAGRWPLIATGLCTISSSASCSSAAARTCAHAKIMFCSSPPVECAQRATSTQFDRIYRECVLSLKVVSSPYMCGALHIVSVSSLAGMLGLFGGLCSRIMRSHPSCAPLSRSLRRILQVEAALHGIHRFDSQTSNGTAWVRAPGVLSRPTLT